MYIVFCEFSFPKISTELSFKKIKTREPQLDSLATDRELTESSDILFGLKSLIRYTSEFLIKPDGRSSPPSGLLKTMADCGLQSTFPCM